MIEIGIVGGTGYTGAELLRLLATHPQARVTQITSRAEAGRQVSELYGNLRGHFDLAFSEPDAKRLVAYVVPAPEQVVEASALRHALAEQLPEYMISAAFVPMAALPSRRVSMTISLPSALATQVIGRIAARFEVDLPLRTFFAGPTIVEFAAWIEQQQWQASAPVDDTEREVILI